MKKSLFTIIFIAAQAINTSAIAQSPEVLESNGNLCLEHIKTRYPLKDPSSAYVRDVTRDGTVYKMTLHARNSYGGIVPQPIACEIKNGRVDTDWTKIHMERLGWGK